MFGIEGRSIPKFETNNNCPNIKYNCYVVIELKVTEYKAEYVGQILKYMNYIDKNIKQISNNNTIGILICKKENKFVIEYCSDERIAVREYELV